CLVERGCGAEGVPKFRGKPQGSYRARPADVTGKYMAQWKDRYRLGLWLRRLDRAAGGVGLLPQPPPSSAASRSASAMSSMVLALKNGSSGCAGQVTVASRERAVQRSIFLTSSTTRA